MMRYNYQSGFENFKRAQATYVRSSLRRRIGFHFCMWGSLLIGVAIWSFAFTRHLGEPLGGTMAGVGGGFVGLGILSVILRPWQLHRAYRTMNGKSKILHVYLEIEDGLLVSGIEGKSEGRFQRSAICETAEDEEMILLFVQPKRFLYLPKKDLHQAGIAEVRRWLELPGGNV